VSVPIALRFKKKKHRFSKLSKKINPFSDNKRVPKLANKLNVFNHTVNNRFLPEVGPNYPYPMSTGFELPHLGHETNRDQLLSSPPEAESLGSPSPTTSHDHVADNVSSAFNRITDWKTSTSSTPELQTPATSEVSYRLLTKTFNYSMLIFSIILC